MCRTVLVAIALMPFGIATPTAAQLRLDGLERLYFDHAAGPGGPFEAPAAVAERLPATLQEPDSTHALGTAVDDEPLSTRDVELPAGIAPGRAWIREVVDRSHPRIFDSWWALYDGGRRQDVWHFTARPERTGGKILGNHAIDGIETQERNRLVLRVRGDMFRPGGAWWVTGKELVFDITPSALTLAWVDNTFGFFRGYDTSESAGTLAVKTERRESDHFETREVDPVPQAVAEECGFRDPAGEDGYEFSWALYADVARCITGRAGAVVGRRALDEPSFVERPAL